MTLIARFFFSVGAATSTQRDGCRNRFSLYMNLRLMLDVLVMSISYEQKVGSRGILVFAMLREDSEEELT